VTVTVLICTCNRAPRLARTLDYFEKLRPVGYTVDLIVVDNRSTDGTARIVRDAAARAAIRIAYAYEPQQGKSFALNHGLRLATGDVLALTDDDVTPAPGWLDRIVDAFRSRDVMFVGGKVLPLWEREPPANLLTRRGQDIWGPLALVDYGDAPFDYTLDAAGQRLPVGANLAFRRAIVEQIGGWRPDLGKVNNTLISGEDHEIFLRLKRAGAYRGAYRPDVIVHHDVPASRLTKRYFRRWFFAWGQTAGLMLEDLYGFVNRSDVPHVAGVPRFLYRQFATQLLQWCRTWRMHDPLERWVEELYTIRFLGLIWERWRLWLRQPARRLFETRALMEATPSP
jgi:glycosyltransferase involved in cell wall biosynthesis